MTIELPARIAFLKKIHLFHGLEEDELAAIAEKLHEELHWDIHVITTAAIEYTTWANEYPEGESNSAGVKPLG